MHDGLYCMEPLSLSLAQSQYFAGTMAAAAAPVPAALRLSLAGHTGSPSPSRAEPERQVGHSV
jgi:hypothetical protein